MLRRFMLAAVVSFLLVWAALWVRSYRVRDWVSYAGPDISLSAASERGTLQVDYARRRMMCRHSTRRWPRTFHHVAAPAREHPHAASLLFYGDLPSRASVWLPVWIPALFTLAAGYATVRPALRARYRRRRGLCPTCGYDLTGSVSAICTECGAPTHDHPNATREPPFA